MEKIISSSPSCSVLDIDSVGFSCWFNLTIGRAENNDYVPLGHIRS